MTWGEIYNRLNDVLNFVLFTLGETKISPSSLIKFILIFSLFIYLSRTVTRWIAEKLLVKLPIQEGKRYVMRRILEYLLIITGAVISFNSIGINLSGLTVIFGLLSVGIGFGLQNITSNFISGLILLFEQPIKVGDRVSVGETEGDVTEINMRSTTIRSLNNISIIVPNSDFISSKVVNWTHGDSKVRLDISIGVSYESDLDLVLQTLKQIAVDNKEVLSYPEPEVLFMEFGDSSWNLELRAWITNPKRHYYVRSDINCEIVRRFRKHNIEIPFPQQDLHVRSSIPMPLKKLENGPE